MTDDSTEIDVSLLFHVIGEAVQKIRDRNVLFWNTVMTITGASISWIDFRRKLSKWLSTNGMGVGHVKNVINFVQQNVDRTSTGIVRKDGFLRFTDDLMGIDCLLSPEGLVALANQPVLRAFPAVSVRPELPAPVFYSAPVSAPPFTNQASVQSSKPVREIPSQQPQIAFQQSVAPINDRVASMEPVTPIQMPSDPAQIRSFTGRGRAEDRESMYNIRVNLGVSSLSRALSSKMRTIFALYRIDSATRSIQPIPVEKRASASSVVMHDLPATKRDTNCLLMAAVIRLVYQRTLGSSFSTLRSLSRETVIHVPDADLSLESIGDVSGPSWTVTIQAVAVSNLFGIMRTGVTRATMPAYFSMKSGHSVDVYNPLRKVLWAQSNQGKKDGLVAAAKIPKSILHPIRENGRMGVESKENVPINELEFDLST